MSSSMPSVCISLHQKAEHLKIFLEADSALRNTLSSALVLFCPSLITLSYSGSVSNELFADVFLHVCLMLIFSLVIAF